MDERLVSVVQAEEDVRKNALPSRVVESDVYLREQRRNQELEARLEAQVHAAAIKRETMLAERECFEKMLEQRERSKRERDRKQRQVAALRRDLWAAERDLQRVQTFDDNVERQIREAEEKRNKMLQDREEEKHDSTPVADAGSPPKLFFDPMQEEPVSSASYSAFFGGRSHLVTAFQPVLEFRQWLVTQKCRSGEALAAWREERDALKLLLEGEETSSSSSTDAAPASGVISIGVQEQAEQVEERWIAAEGRHPVKPGLPRPFEDIVKEVDCSSEDVLNLVVDGRRTQCVNTLVDLMFERGSSVPAAQEFLMQGGLEDPRRVFWRELITEVSSLLSGSS